MKKLALFLTLAAMVATKVLAVETVTLSIGEWVPYFSQHDPKGKLLEQVVTEAFKLEGVEVKYQYLPWKRSYANAESGVSDGTVGWNKTEERERRFHLNKEPLIRDEAVFFQLKSKPFDWNTLDDLKKYKVGVTIGYKQEKIYQKLGIEADPVPSEDLNFKKLLAGRIDVYQTAKPAGYAMIRRLFGPDEAFLFTTHPKPLEVAEYYILFSGATLNGKLLAEKFDSGFKKLKDSGAYNKILMDYGLAPQ